MAKRDEIAQQGLIILDAKGVADIRGTAERLEDAGVASSTATDPASSSARSHQRGAGA